MGADSPGQIRVLHVDDESRLLSVAERHLQRHDDRFSVETATDVYEALDVLASETFDCIVSDYDMPGVDGIEFLEAVREEYPDLPFILFTGRGSEEVASDAISAGVTDYLQKTTDTERFTLLANRIDNAVDAYRSERQLDQRTRRLTTLISNLPGVVYQSEKDGGWAIQSIDGQVEELTGYTADEIESGDVVWTQDIIHPDDLERVLSAVETALDAEDSFKVTYRIRTSDGTTKHVRERGRGVFTDDGDLDVLDGFITDVTEQRRRERELERKTERLETEVERRKATETRYRSLFENNPSIIWEEDFSAAKAYLDDLMADVDDVAAFLRNNPDELEALLERVEVLDVNEKALEYYGADSKAELMNSLDEVVTEEARDTNSEMWAAIAAGETEFRSETVARTLDGRRLEAILELYVPEAYADDYSRVYISSTDITDRKRRERELQRQRAEAQRFQELLEQALAATDTFVWEWDLQSDSVSRYPSTEPLFGLPPAKLGGVFDGFVERVHPEDRDMVERTIRNGIESGESYEFECRIRRADGSWLWVHDQAEVVSNDEGEPVRAVGSLTDVSDRKAYQQELREQAEQLDEVADVVSHDLQGSLAAVRTRLAGLRDAVEGDRIDPIERDLDRMETALDDLLAVAETDESAEETASSDERVARTDAGPVER